MSNTDWDEIKRLAADLQRAQLSSTTQRYHFLLVKHQVSTNVIY